MTPSIRLFCSIARLRNFSAGAREHFLTQSAASQRVRTLEEQLGVILFDRSIRPLALTPAGQELFAGALQLIERYDALEARVKRFGEDSGSDDASAASAEPVRVAAIYSAGIDLLRHIEKQFQLAHAGAQVVIRYQRPEAVHAAVHRRECDIGIVSYPQTWDDVSSLHLRDETMSIICNPTHPLASGRKANAARLGRWPMIGFEPSLPVAKQIRRYLRKHGVETEPTNVFDNIDTLKSAVADTDQIAIMPRRTARREADAGSLAIVELEPKLTRPLGIIFRGRRSELAPFVQEFVEMLIEHAGPASDMVLLQRRARQQRATQGATQGATQRATHPATQRIAPSEQRPSYKRGTRRLTEVGA